MSSNGLLSFGSGFSDYLSQIFPRSGPPPLIAPYWTDIDLSGGVGDVRYTVYTTENGESYIDQVNEFLANETDGFIATTILVAQWIDVCPFGNHFCSEVPKLHNSTSLAYCIFLHLKACFACQLAMGCPKIDLDHVHVYVYAHHNG